MREEAGGEAERGSRGSCILLDWVHETRDARQDRETLTDMGFREGEQ